MATNPVYTRLGYRAAKSQVMSELSSFQGSGYKLIRQAGETIVSWLVTE